MTSGERVVLVDDLLATGGTSAAAAVLIRKAGGHLLEAQFLIELEFLHGRETTRADTGHIVFEILSWSATQLEADPLRQILFGCHAEQTDESRINLTTPVDTARDVSLPLDIPMPLKEKAQNTKPCSSDAVILAFEFPT